MTSSYGEIVERLEKLEGPDRSLDLEIARVLCPDVLVLRQRNDDSGSDPYTYWKYTASLDAAVALVEKMLPSAAPGVSKNVHHGHWYGWLARICPDEAAATEMFSEGMSEANAAIALLICLFRALTVNQNG